MSAGELAGLRVGVVGASGYIGRLLVPALRDAGATVRAIGRSPGDLERIRDVAFAQADALDPIALRRALDGLDLVYWLVHSLGAGNDFEAIDRAAATNGAAAAASAGVGRIVYLGGLGDDAPELSRHLKSRLETGRILAAGPVPVTTLRAAMIVGSRSASFRMLHDLVRRLPVMVAPGWVRNRTQPIAFVDVRRYLIGVAAERATIGRTLDIGGPDILTYRGMMDRVAALLGRRPPRVLEVPVLTPALSARWSGVVTGVERSVARPLIEGLRNETVVRDDAIRRLVPFAPMGFDDAVRRALSRPDLPY